MEFVKHQEDIRKNINKIRRNGFHAKYLAACKTKNANPLQEVRMKQDKFQVLDFHGDRMSVGEWFTILECLFEDMSLDVVNIRLRRNTELSKKNFSDKKEEKKKWKFSKVNEE